MPGIFTLLDKSFTSRLPHTNPLTPPTPMLHLLLRRKPPTPDCIMEWCIGVTGREIEE